MSMQQRCALQAEQAVIEAMRAGVDYTTIGFFAGALIASTPYGWEAH